MSRANDKPAVASLGPEAIAEIDAIQRGDNSLSLVLARETLERAREDLGRDLAGGSVTDLLADNFPAWSLEECRAIAAELEREDRS